LLPTPSVGDPHFVAVPFKAGLPDGLFSNKKSQFGFVLEGLAMENLGILYDHLVYFTAIGNILWPFGIFLPFWVFCTKKNLAALL
jgi:hypothetical protein